MKIEQLLQQCPHQLNEEELKALEDNAREFNPSTIKVFHSNYPAMFEDLQAKLKAKYTHSEYDFNIKRNGCIELIYGIPPAKIKSNLAESLEKVRADYQANLEAKQQAWINEQLAEFIELERKEAEQAQAAKEAEYKQQLFKLLKETEQA